MSTITREQQRQILIETANHIISRENTSPHSENLRELARIALSSLTTEPDAQIKPAADLYALCWQPGDVVTYTPEPEKATIWLSNYAGTCVQEYVTLERLQEALAGNSPVTPDGWIKCSERMPEDDDFVYIWPRPDFGIELHVAQYGKFDKRDKGWYAQVYEQNYGIEYHPITVTHWMPLPAAPQQEVKNV